MKKIIFALALLVTLTSGIAFAQENEQDVLTTEIEMDSSLLESEYQETEESEISDLQESFVEEQAVQSNPINPSFINKGIGLIFLVIFCWMFKMTIEIICFGKMIIVKTEGPWYDRNHTKERTTPLMKDTDVDGNITITFLVISCIALIALFFSACVGLAN